MNRLKTFLMCTGLLLLVSVISGCALIQLPFQMLGMAVGAAGKAAQFGMAAAPYAAPYAVPYAAPFLL